MGGKGAGARGGRGGGSSGRLDSESATTRLKREKGGSGEGVATRDEPGFDLKLRDPGPIAMTTAILGLLVWMLCLFQRSSVCWCTSRLTRAECC